MNSQHASLRLPDLEPGSLIEIVDQFRKLGIHGRVERIIVKDGGDIVTFTDINREITYAWQASAMGLIEGVSSFWTTFWPGREPAGVSFEPPFKWGHGDSKTYEVGSYLPRRTS